MFVVTLADNQIITIYGKPKVGIFSDDPDIFPEEVHIVKSEIQFGVSLTFMV